MGDPARFREFAKVIRCLSSPAARIADVAGGKGGLRSALALHNYYLINPSICAGW